MNLKNKTERGWRRRRILPGRHHSYRMKRYEWWRPGRLRLRRHPLCLLSQIHSNSRRLQMAITFYLQVQMHWFFFASCCVSKNLTTPKRWDFSLLSRFSGNFQNVSWYFQLCFWIFFRGTSLSWGSPGALWTSSVLRQATVTFHGATLIFMIFILELMNIDAFKLVI